MDKEIGCYSCRYGKITKDGNHEYYRCDFNECFALTQEVSYNVKGRYWWDNWEPK
jgi:hypothetical protein